MKKIIFDYWTNLMRCGCGGNVGGTTSVSLNEEQANAFVGAIIPAKKTRDMLKYFEENLSLELSDIVYKAIKDDFNRVMATEALCECGIDVFSSDITKEEYESLTQEQLVDRLLQETSADADEADYTIVDIEIKNI